MFTFSHKNTKAISLLLSIALLFILPNTLYATFTNTNQLTNTNSLSLSLEKLKNSYPEHILAIIENPTEGFIIWTDGTMMPLHNPTFSHLVADPLNNSSLADQLQQPLYIPGNPITNPSNDPGRIRYEPFFRKMYGNSPQEVESNLTSIAWMPHVFGEATHILRVTTVNAIHEKIQKISKELEILVAAHPEYIDFLNNPGGTYCWRNIANTTRLSNHSFGMTLDINATLSQYWQWDLAAEHSIITEEIPLTYRNTIPWEIVSIFEKYGFIWGGKWYHYDTMHFEYRPELIDDQHNTD